MKFNRLALTLASIIVIFSLVACGAAAPTPITTAAKDLNLTIEDLGSAYTMAQTSEDPAALGLDASAPVNNASLRLFSTQNLKVVSSIVLNVKTIKEAEDAFASEGFASKITSELKSSLISSEFQEVTGKAFGDKTIMYASDDLNMGKVYLVVFRKANIISVLLIMGQGVSEDNAVEIVKKLEAKIK